MDKGKALARLHSAIDAIEQAGEWLRISWPDGEQTWLDYSKLCDKLDAVKPHLDRVRMMASDDLRRSKNF